MLGSVCAVGGVNRGPKTTIRYWVEARVNPFRYWVVTDGARKDVIGVSTPFRICGSLTPYPKQIRNSNDTAPYGFGWERWGS